MHNSSPRAVPQSKVHTPAPATKTFFSSIQKFSDDRENIHCGRLSRVKKTLINGKEAQMNSVQGVSDLRAIIPLVSDFPPPVGRRNDKSGEVSSHHAAPGRSTDLSKTTVKSSIRRPPQGSSVDSSVSVREPIVQQYRNAVYHHTESSTTSVVRICSNENTKEVDLINSFVKSELSSATISFPNQPSRNQQSNISNASPNKKHRAVTQK
jgi:hypothetical protein